jgi:heterodisulfide reductase subunit C
VVWPVINLITDRTNFLKTESDQLQEQVISQGKQIIELKEQIKSLRNEIQIQINDITPHQGQHNDQKRETANPTTVKKINNDEEKKPN